MKSRRSGRGGRGTGTRWSGQTDREEERGPDRQLKIPEEDGMGAGRPGGITGIDGTG